MTNYDNKYTSLGTEYELDLSRPFLYVITGRGTHAVTNRRGSMACVVHAVVRVLFGRRSQPYDGRQLLSPFELSSVGLKLLAKISDQTRNGNVSKAFSIRKFNHFQGQQRTCRRHQFAIPT